MESKDSKLNLEETLIPYSDSFDLKKNNELEYILRLGNPYLFEKQILLSRSSPYDSDSLETISDNLNELVNWYHSTVYSLQKDILNKNETILREPKTFVSGCLFDLLNKNFDNAKNMLLACDIILLKDNFVYRYLLKENVFLKIYSYVDSDILKLQPEQTYFDSLKEILCIITNPKRLAVVYGEKAYQKSLILSGELSFLLQNLFSSSMLDVKIRKIEQFYDLKWINILGYEDADRILTHIFEVHQ